MKNGFNHTDYENINHDDIKNMSKNEMQRILAEKFDYISSLIKYSKTSWLKMKEYIPQEGTEGTFTCGLGEEGDVYFQDFMEGKIKFEEIPAEYFEPKYLYYRLPLLLTKENDVLGPIIDHELQRAESTDFGDIIWNSREAIIHDLPVTSVGMFFNTFEDMYISKNQIRRGRAKRMGVLNLYRDMLQTSGQLDLSKSKLKLDQFSTLSLYNRLKKEFPNEFQTEVLVDDDVQEEFDNFLPYLEEILDIQIPNKERIQKKNEVLWPIIDRLGQKDMQTLKESKIKEEIEQEKEEQQEQLEDNEENTNEDSSDSSGESGNGGEGGGEGGENGNGGEGGGEGGENGNGGEGGGEGGENGNGGEGGGEGGENGNGGEGGGEGGENGNGGEGEGEGGENGNGGEGGGEGGESENGGEGGGEWGENENGGEGEGGNQNGGEKGNKVSHGNRDKQLNSGIEEEIRRRLDAMTPEEMEKLVEQIKNEVDKKNMQEHGNDLQLQKELLGKKNEKIDGKLEDMLSNDGEKRQSPVIEEKLGQKIEESQQKTQDQLGKVIDLEQREDDLEQYNKIQKILAEIAKTKIGENLEKIEELQKELEQLEGVVENIVSEDVRDKADNAIKIVKAYIDQWEQSYERQLEKSGFSRDEEDLYHEYLEIEKEMEKYVDQFIKELENEIPKLKELNLAGGYSSGRVSDMNEAGRKIRLKQWGEKLYSRPEENESMKVNLGICLSIDNSLSMSEELYDTRRLSVFLGLLCQRWGIPFHINTFSDDLNVIKDIEDEFETRKGNFMRELNADGGNTNMSVSVKENLKVINDMKKKDPDIVFLPIFITDGAANRGETGDSLIELMKGFKGLSIVAGIGVNEYRLEERYPDSKIIGMRDSSEIMTKLLKSLQQFFVQNKSEIFKIVSE